MNTNGLSPAAMTVHQPTLARLAVILTGTFMSTLDFFIVNVAVPSFVRNLHASNSSIQLIIASYAVGYGVFLITGGKLGDLFGRRRTYLWGTAFFTLSSVACGFAQSTSFLVAARFAQGVSASLVAPQVLAIINASFTAEGRATGFRGYGIAMGVAAVLGQLIGGILIQLDPFGLGWRSCFLVNLPVGLAALVLIPRLVPESRASARPTFDTVGTVLVTLALLAVVVPLVEGRADSWPWWSMLMLSAALPIAAVFVLYERHVAARGRSPLVDMTLFKERAFGAGLAAQLILWLGQASYFLILAIYLQQGRGLSALDAGMVFAALGAGYMLTSTTVGRFAPRLGANVIALGGIVRAAGLGLLLLALHIFGSGVSIVLILPGLAIDGAGMGLAIAPLASTILSRISREHAGAASGVLTTDVQVGNAVGVALIGLLFYSTLTGWAGNRATGVAATPPGIGAAFQRSLLLLIAVGLSLAVVVQFLPRTQNG